MKTSAQLDAEARRLSLAAVRSTECAVAAKTAADARFYRSLAEDETRRATQSARAATLQARRERATW